MQGSTSEQYSFLAFKGLDFLEELSLLVFQSMSLVEDQQLAFLSQALTIAIELLVTGEEEAVVVIYEHSYGLINLLRISQGN